LNKWVGLWALLWSLAMGVGVAQPRFEARSVALVSNDVWRAELLLQVEAASVDFADDTAGQCRAQLRVELSLTRPNGSVAYRAELPWQPEWDESQPANRQWLRWQIALPGFAAGDYQLGILLLDGMAQQASWQQLAVWLPDPKPNMAAHTPLADIVLHWAGKPWASHLIPTGTRSLEAQLQWLQPPTGTLVLRTVLYRRSDEPAAEAAQNYVSILQRSRAPKAAPGWHTTTETFNLRELLPGEYLLELYAQQDDRIVAQRSVAFTRVWDGVTDVLQEIDRSLAQLEPLAGAQVVAQLRSLPSAEAQREALLGWWRRRAQSAATPEVLLLSNYYQQVELTNERFTEADRPGWQTPRGQLWLRLGPPDDLVRPDSLTETWRYRKFNLGWHFALRLGRWETVAEPS
jgi:GWxTD domain-containing protein